MDQKIRFSKRIARIAGYVKHDFRVSEKPGRRDHLGQMLIHASQVDYFKKQRVVNYQKEQTIKRIEAQGGEIAPIEAPQLPLRRE